MAGRLTLLIKTEHIAILSADLPPDTAPLLPKETKASHLEYSGCACQHRIDTPSSNLRSLRNREVEKVQNSRLVRHANLHFATILVEITQPTTGADP